MNFFLVLFLCPLLVSSSGVLYFRFDSFENSLGRDSSGRCCSDPQSSVFDDSSSDQDLSSLNSRSRHALCSSPCRVFFRVCLKQFQHNIDTNSPCTFGEVTTPVLGNNSIQTPGYIVPFFFNFSWPGTCSYIVDVGHEPFEGSRTIPGRSKMIYQLKRQTQLNVSSEWTPESHEIGGRSKARINFALRVSCNENYFGPQCQDYCRARDDTHGHFTCLEKGQMKCLPGWKNPENYCRDANCLPGCHNEHGTCSRPDECKCRPGWEGPNCDRCVRSPGCLHGTCGKPGECICKEGWGGIYCNQDLNYCTTHRPCKNKGTCYNSGIGSFNCVCPPNFTGKNCEFEVTNCEDEPCRNGATCRNELEKGNYTCNCPLGYTGRNCESLASLCDVNPCLSGGTCIQGPSGHMCICPPGDFDENNNCNKYTGCHQNPCKNDGKCSSTSSGYTCSCESGFSGSNCEVNEDDCSGVTCENGGTCRDGVRGYRCLCPAGFSGRHCQEMVDLCLYFPCANGGTCVDTNGIDFTCSCSPGFTGKDCSINVNECQPNPCLNNGLCTDRVNEFVCTCPQGFTGSICQYGHNGTSIYLTMDEVPDLASSGLMTEKTSEKWTAEGLLLVSASIALPFIIILTVVVIWLVIRKRRLESDRRKSERMARSQNEANSRRNKHLDDDPFKGSMIINSLREDPNFRSNFQLNREKSATLSKLSNNEYRSNLKMCAASQYHLSPEKGACQQFPTEFSTFARTKSNNKLASMDAPANNMRAKSSCKLNSMDVEPLVVSVLPDIAVSSSHHSWVGHGHRLSVTPPHGSPQRPQWGHASSLYRSQHHLNHHQQHQNLRPESMYHNPNAVRRAPELQDPRAEYVDFSIIKSNIINC